MRVRVIQQLIDKLRKKGSLSKKILSSNDISVPKSIANKIKFNVDGKNNRIIFKPQKLIGNISINIFGDNNEVIFEEGFYLSSSLNIIIGQNHHNFGKVYNSKFFIGKNTTVESLNYITFNSNTYCNIEENCMLSYGITLYNTDGHPIFDKDTRKIINKIKGITIGKHSWIGMNATILKNSFVPPNSIIGCNTVFSGGGKTHSYCAFAGNPARIVKENVDWDANGNICGYINN